MVLSQGQIMRTRKGSGYCRGVEREQESQHKENHTLNLLWGQEQHRIYPWLKFGPSRLLLFFSLSKMWWWGLGSSRCLWCLQGTSSSVDKGKGRWKLRLLSNMIFGEAKIIKCCCQRTLRLPEGGEGGVSFLQSSRSWSLWSDRVSFCRGNVYCSHHCHRNLDSLSTK